MTARHSLRRLVVVALVMASLFPASVPAQAAEPSIPGGWAGTINIAAEPDFAIDGLYRTDWTLDPGGLVGPPEVSGDSITWNQKAFWTMSFRQQTKLAGTSCGDGDIETASGPGGGELQITLTELPDGTAWFQFVPVSLGTAVKSTVTSQFWDIFPVPPFPRFCNGGTFTAAPKDPCPAGIGPYELPVGASRSHVSGAVPTGVGGASVCSSAFTGGLIVWDLTNDLGRIEVEKLTNVHNPLAFFPFQGALNGLILDGQVISKNVAPGTYETTEVDTPGWLLEGITCDDTDSVGDVASATATMVVATGEVVRCVFTSRDINQSPVAEPDAWNRDLWEPPGAATYTIDVLDNDHDPDGDPIAVTSVSTPLDFPGDLLQLDPYSGEFQFQPPKDWFGGTEFDYTISDGNGGKDTANVRILIRACTSQDIRLEQYIESFAGETVGEVASFEFNSQHCTDGEETELVGSELNTGIARTEWLSNAAISAGLSLVSRFAIVRVDTRWLAGEEYGSGATGELTHCVAVGPKIVPVPSSWVRQIWRVAGDVLARLGVNPTQVTNFVATQINKPLTDATVACVDPEWEPRIDVAHDTNGPVSTDVFLGLQDGGRPGSVFDAVRVLRNGELIADVREFTSNSRSVDILCTDPWSLQCSVLRE